MSAAVEVLIIESMTADESAGHDPARHDPARHDPARHDPARLDPAWRASLEHEPALHTVGEAELAASGAAGAVALVVLPLSSPKSGIARIAGLKERHPGLRILVAFQSLDADGLGRLLALGADALVARSAPPREVCAAILALAQAGPAAAEHPLEASDGLTPREAEILRFLSSGFSNKEVARRLSLSVRTVETHRLNLRRKTQTGRLKDLVSLARQLGLSPILDAEPARRGQALTPAALPAILARH